MTSLNQLGLIIHALAITYSLLCMHERAHHIFSILTVSESKTTAFSILRDINPFYQEYYTRKAERHLSDLEKEKRIKLALAKDREILQLKLIKAALDQKMNLNKNIDRKIYTPWRCDYQSSQRNDNRNDEKDVDNDDDNDNEVKNNENLGHASNQSFSSVLNAVLKTTQATTWMKKMMKQKQNKLEYLKRSDMTNYPPDTPYDSHSELDHFIPLLTEKIASKSFSTRNSVGNSVENSARTSTCNSAKISAKNSPKISARNSSKNSETTGVAAAEKPFDVKATIRFQISLMTGRGLDGIKAELCTLNALAVIDGLDVSSSLLYNPTQPMTAAEYCEEGLRCVGYHLTNEDLLATTFDLSPEPDHPNLCDLFHTLLVKARLLSILSKLPPEIRRPAYVASPTSSTTPCTSPPNTERSNESTAYTPSPPTSARSFPLPSFPQPPSSLYSSSSSSTTTADAVSDIPYLPLLPIATTSDNKDIMKPKDCRSSYAAQANSVLRKCAVVGRSTDAPGVMYLSGLKMIEYRLSIKYGKELLRDAMQIASKDQIERMKLREIQSKICESAKRRLSSRDTLGQKLGERLNRLNDFTIGTEIEIEFEIETEIESDGENESESDGCFFHDSVPSYNLADIPLVIDAMRALDDS